MTRIVGGHMTRKLPSFVGYFFLLYFLVAAAAATESELSAKIEYFPPGLAFDSAVPRPSDSLGYEVGQWHVRHDQLVSYMQKLAETSARVELEVLGRSYEDRTLLQITISSPQNLAQLDSIKARHRALLAVDATNVDTEDLPVLVSLNYSIHGNEPSGSNAALLVAYYLAAAQGSTIEELLDNTVVILNPSLNPDGLSLFTTWVNYHKGVNPAAHPLSREHMAPWPAGRMNHYLFNLNRDWLFLQQRETQVFAAQYRDLLPHIVADFHETGTNTTAYFQPGVPTRVHPLTTARNQELTADLAKFIAAAYDEQGLLYYTRERFDDFYHGKSSTYADVIGSIGLTFEVGSSRGHLKDSINGPLEFTTTIRKQLISSLALIEAAHELRQELLDYQLEYFQAARNSAARDKVQYYVVGDEGDPFRLREFSRLLLRQGIDTFELGRRVDVDGVEFLPGNAVVVPTRQASYWLIKSLFERRIDFVEPVFYDISSWNAPFAFNLPVGEAGNIRSSLGTRLALPMTEDKGAPPDASDYAYIFSWQDWRAPRALSKLLAQDVSVRVLSKPLSIQTDNNIRSFRRGSIVIPVGHQENLLKPLHEIVQEVALQSGIEISSVAGGLARDGVDLGSSSIKPVDSIRPVLIAGSGVSRAEVGEIWFLFDQQLDMPLPIVDIANFPRMKLDDFTHLILVDGNYDALNAHIKELNQWVADGGILILQRRASIWGRRVLRQPASGDKPLELNGQSALPADDELPSSPPYSSQASRSRLGKIAGAILQVEIDSSHPIGFGYEHNEVAVMRQGQHILPFLPNPYANPGRYSDAPLLSGYASTENIERLRRTPAITAEKVGDGLIVSFADNPNFRAYFYGSSKLFLNALFFGQTVDYID